MAIKLKPNDLNGCGGVGCRVLLLLSTPKKPILSASASRYGRTTQTSVALRQDHADRTSSSPPPGAQSPQPGRETHRPGSSRGLDDPADTPTWRQTQIIKLCKFGECIEVAVEGERAGEERESGLPPRILSGQRSEPCPCLVLHYGRVTQGDVCSLNTINKVSPAHQYCHLHSVLIGSPYNHKMLIAPINSQSVCALVWS